MPPPYVTLKACEEIKQSVRTFFASGHKSANKRYDDLAPVSDDKWNKRARGLAGSSQGLTKFRKTADLFGLTTVERAEALIKRAPVSRSGNCGEMAVLSAYYAWRFYNIDRSRIYTGEVTAPGDHAFCLIAPVKIAPSCLQFNSVTDFVDSGSVAQWAICDPWLNVACGASDYLTNAGEKLNKWMAEGKRIAWDDGTGARWWPPVGPYKDKFCEAPVKLDQF